MPATLTLFAGSANPDLSVHVAESLDAPVGTRTILTFPDGEMQVELHQSVRGHDVYLLQSTSPPAERHLVELALLADVCRRAGAARITALVPYFGYARQDRRTKPRQSLGGRVMADIFGAIPLERMVILDLHAPAIEGFFSVPVEHLSAVPLLADAVRSHIQGPSIVVAPDLGAVKLAERYARQLDLPLAIVHKSRLSGDTVSVRQIIGDVRNRTPIIIDDMLSTGATVAAALAALLAAGCAPSALCLVTHGLFVGQAESALGSLPIERIITTDSVAQRTTRLNVEVRSLAPLLAAAVRRLHDDQSLADL
jgi:ribose-phosphate pyrophosphokinase